MEKNLSMREAMTDGQISVRMYRIDDILNLYEGVCESIAELTRWGFYHPGFTVEDAEKDVISRIQDWNQGRSFTYLIEALPGQVFLGNCGIAEVEHEAHHAALGWWVRTSRTRKGIATAAAHLVARAAFKDLLVDVLYIYTKIENVASRRVAEKIGAVLTKIKPEDDGSFCAVYQLTPDFECKTDL